MPKKGELYEKLAKDEKFLKKVEKIAKERGLPLTIGKNFLCVGPVQFNYRSHKYKNIIKKEGDTGINGFLMYLRTFEIDEETRATAYSVNNVREKTNKVIVESWMVKNDFFFSEDKEQGCFYIDNFQIYHGIEVYKDNKKLGEGFDELEKIFGFLEPSISLRSIAKEITKVEDYNEKETKKKYNKNILLEDELVVENEEEDF